MSFLRTMDSRRGFTLVELMIASFISLIVVLGLGQLILVSQSAWKWGAGKTELQGNVAEATEWMARSVRLASAVTLVSDSDFITRNEDGNPLHRYQVGSDGAGGRRILEDGKALVDQDCTDFSVTANEDTTSVTLSLELRDAMGNKVAAMTTATLRNRSLEF